MEDQTPIPEGSLPRAGQVYQNDHEIYLNVGRGGSYRLARFQDVQYKTVETIAERNAIDEIFRTEGMLVWVNDALEHYMLVGGLENANWTPYLSGTYATITGSNIDLNAFRTALNVNNVDNTSDATKNSAVSTLTNKTLTSPVINSPTGITTYDITESINLYYTEARVNANTEVQKGVTAFGWGNHAGLYLPLTGGELTGLLTSSNSINATGFVGIGVGNSYSSALSIAGLEISTDGISQRLYGPAITPSLNTVLRFPLDLSGTVALTSGELDNIKLSTTINNNTGIIFKNGSPFLHDYKPPSNTGLNLFIGENSGNFTMSGASLLDASYNLGVGDNTLKNATVAYVNVAIGSRSMEDTTSADGNVGVGVLTLRKNVGGDHNVAIGYGALSNVDGDMINLVGYENTALGFFAGSTVTTGRENIFIGSNAGSGVGNKVDAVNSMALGAGVNIAADNTYYYGNGLVQNHIFAGNLVSVNANISGKLTWGSGIYEAGLAQLYNTATSGTTLVAKTGSVNDLVLANGIGSTIFNVPTGTQDVIFQGSTKTGSFSTGTSGNGYPLIGHNVKYTGTANSYQYNQSDNAWALDFGNSNLFRLRYATAGTAGNTITFTDFLTFGTDGTATFIDKVIVGDATATNHAVNKGQLDLKANIASPTFTGAVTAPTIVSTVLIRLKGYTVATLPAGTQGDIAFVTDATAPTFLATVVGGGAVVTKVFYDGTNWVTQ